MAKVEWLVTRRGNYGSLIVVDPHYVYWLCDERQISVGSSGHVFAIPFHHVIGITAPTDRIQEPAIEVSILTYGSSMVGFRITRRVSGGEVQRGADRCAAMFTDFA